MIVKIDISYDLYKKIYSHFAVGIHFVLQIIQNFPFHSSKLSLNCLNIFRFSIQNSSLKLLQLNNNLYIVRNDELEYFARVTNFTEIK
jgi:hypothetical protein